MISLAAPLRSAFARSTRMIQMRSMHAEARMAFPMMEEPFRAAVTSLTTSEDLIRDNVRLFAEDAVKPHVASMDSVAQMNSQVLEGCFSRGFMGSEARKNLGGGGMGFLASCITVEELARVDPSVAALVDTQNTLITSVLMKWATPEQQQEWVPRLAKDTIGSFCLSEWGCGSDAFAIKTTAEPVANGFALNGKKAWITAANEAGVFIVLANANPAKGHKGITAFLVDRKTPGIHIGEKQEKEGLRGAASHEVVFENCVVPAKNVLGVIGKGYRVAMESLNQQRIGKAAQTLGIAQGAFDVTMPLVMLNREHQRSTHALCRTKFQETQHQLARAALDIATARLMVYNAARLKEEKKSFVQESSMAKLISAEVADKVTSMCSSLLVGSDEREAEAVEKLTRDLKQMNLAEAGKGNAVDQLQTIANGIMRAYQ